MKLTGGQTKIAEGDGIVGANVMFCGHGEEPTDSGSVGNGVRRHGVCVVGGDANENVG